MSSTTSRSSPLARAARRVAESLPHAASRIIHVVMDVHKDSITLAVLARGREDRGDPPATAQRAPQALPRPDPARSAGRAPVLLRSQRRRVRALPRAPRLGLRERRHCPVAHAEEARRAAASVLSWDRGARRAGASDRDQRLAPLRAARADRGIPRARVAGRLRARAGGAWAPSRRRGTATAATS